MGVLYAALFYYGISLEPGFEEYKPEIFLRELDEFRAPEGVDVKKWYREIEQDKHGAKCLDAAWGDDPISIQWNRSIHRLAHCETNPFFAVRETVLRSDDLGSIFTLPNAPTAEWDRLIRRRCEEHGIIGRWGGEFRVWSGDFLEAVFFYGRELDWKDVRKILGENASEEWWEEILDLDYKWERQGDPIFIECLADSEYNEILYIVGIRAVRHAFHQKTEISFQLDFVDTARWDQLLRAKCERYGIAWREPAFHLTTEVI